MSGRDGAGGPELDLALVFAVDSSGSVSNERMAMYIEGHAAAVTSPAFLAGLANLPGGRMALAYVAWSNHDKQQYIVPWQVVDGPRAAAEWAHTLRTAVRPANLESGLGWRSAVLGWQSPFAGGSGGRADDCRQRDEFKLSTDHQPLVEN